ncbi:bifunctional proline dehydrogenase/L-glutamate gamma-semialdehyde dehydrogenase PutA [Ferrovibrio xuzhouensis]|uniref:Bifunctional protein PutA n=1 Tax=Ferrovibrio xuzhouensis TaxID=1576914 RepID=A0ABV7VAT4_9PROT
MTISAAYRAPEPDLLLPLMRAAGVDPATRQRIVARAGMLVAAMQKAAATAGGLAQFLNEYRISTTEGVVLLCLAEAFLRIPDAETADRLIRDKLGPADWQAHLGQSSAFFVNASTLALTITGRLLSRGETDGILKDMVARLGEPVIRRAVRMAMHLMGGQFVMGRTIEEGLKHAAAFEARGFRHSFDMLGEGAKTAPDAARYLDHYRQAIAALGRHAKPGDLLGSPGLSVKLSALHPRYEPAQRDRVLRELGPVLVSLGVAARDAGIGLTVDAEESERLELSLELFALAARTPELRGWDGLGLAVQAYQKRAPAVLDGLEALGAETGRRIFVRLVKGAYWDSEIKRSQERGLAGYPVFTRKAATDVSYLACARRMLDAPHLYPAFATHNALTVATLLEWADERRDFEFQRLHGMGEGLYETLLAGDSRLSCRTYAPVGSHEELLAYLVRRILENGANSSFVHGIQEAHLSLDTLLADPVAQVAAMQAQPHPRIPLPAALYGTERRNSTGLDLSDDAVAAPLLAGLAAAWEKPWAAAALVDGRETGAAPVPLFDPAAPGRLVAEVRAATAGDAARAVDIAAAAQPGWDAAGAARRAACLRRAADLLDQRMTEFMAVAIREAGKTIPDAVAEVREAVDFLRYYALRAEADFAAVELPGPTGEENRLFLVGRGVCACISPWNFPLAIFIGQVAAALAAGNAVVAKPAPQTPVMGWHAVRLLHEAGVPVDVLHLLPGGPEVGAAILAHPLVRCVAFTGSTVTAKRINRQLAESDGPIIPLIAETGGQNAMIVDSSALPEQVVNDLIVSAFQSAGQRCSAARVLFVQEDIADRVENMLFGAMDELVLGDPGRLATDMGPVIDQAAQQRLLDHLERFSDRLAHRLAAPQESGWFVPPAAIRLDDLSALQGEVFGPVLHILRWQAGHLDRVIAAINGTGFGLTLGIHSRIGETVEQVRRQARVGNIYVNRSMIGAVVGVQPFGGEGLSGTGPKAGGPNYLRRFATERVVSTDTTSAGGNASLMAMEAV